MLNPGYTTISKFLIQQVPEGPHGRELAALLVDVAAVIKAISAAVGKGPLVGLAGLAGTENTQGERRSSSTSSPTSCSRAASNGASSWARSPRRSARTCTSSRAAGASRWCIDPLDGSNNLDVNLPVGSIFSVLALPETARNTARRAATGHAAARGGLRDLRAVDAGRDHRRAAARTASRSTARSATSC